MDEVAGCHSDCRNSLAGVEAATAQSGPPYYEENVSASDPLRAEQARRLRPYILKMKTDESRLRSVFTPDYRSPKAFEASAKRLRQAFAASIGYPPPSVPAGEPGKPEREAPEFKRIGEDGIGVCCRIRISRSCRASMPRGSTSCRRG